MRIISGYLKGKKIEYLKNKVTRPLKDSVKENIFNILSHSNHFKADIKGSKVLDFYSGIGSFGIECISRGANEIVLVENNKLAISILEKNLNSLAISNKAMIINNIIEKNELKKRIKGKYNIIFLDPPFADIEFKKNLELIKKNKYFADKHILIIHRSNKSMDKLDDIINIVSIKKYGRSKIIFGFFL